MCSNLHESPYYSTDKLLNVWDVGTIKGITGVWFWCLRDAVSTVYLSCRSFMNTPGVVSSMSAVHAGESPVSYLQTRLKRKFPGIDD